MLPTFNVITCRRCGRSFMAPSPRYRFCPGCQKEKRRRTDACPTGREALPCLIPTTSPPPFCSKNRAKRRLFFYTTLPNLRGKMRMPGCTVPRSMAAGTARTANTRLYQRMLWPPWYATGSPVPRLPGHVRKGWTSPSASSPTGMMTMAAAAGKHGQRHRPTLEQMADGGSG